MISSGHPRGSATKTEVIELKNNNVTCEDLQDFSLEISNAVGANLVSWPIICGGTFHDETSDKCFIYMEGGWQHFVTMINRRSFTAGIVYDDAFHIFGGYDKDESTTLQSSEIINIDGSSTAGPQLPTPIQRHAIASINSTVSIIIGGGIDNYSNQTWYFNHKSQDFQPGPNLLELRWYHSSATITDQETKEKIVIVVGGYNGNFMDTTEILSNGEWVSGINHKQFLYLSNYKALSLLKLGPTLPKGLFSHSMVEVGENLYIIGGDSDDDYLKEIHKLTCVSGSCSWTTLTQQLKEERMNVVAIPVMESFCNSN